ncbi:MAG: hypothetical protein RMM98_17955 [Acidobacteriota bacterium]|nr:hypothetical protein [Acidobacteriota bacterium]
MAAHPTTSRERRFNQSGVALTRYYAALDVGGFFRKQEVVPAIACE